MVVTTKARENPIYIDKISKLTEKLEIEVKDISIYILVFSKKYMMYLLASNISR